MARQKSDPSLERFLGEYVRWGLFFLAVLGGIGALAFICTKPAVSEAEITGLPANAISTTDGNPAPHPDP